MADPTTHAGTDPATLPENREADERSDLEQIVGARADAVARGEGGEEPAIFTDSGRRDGVDGTGGDPKNQDLTAQ
jgi:hypothetical protein